MDSLRPEVTIVGGGLSGTSLAYYMSLAGCQVTLLDIGSVGASGATAASRGIVRVYDPQVNLMRAALDGVRVWRDLEDLSPGLFTECGCMYLLDKANREDAQSAVLLSQADDYPIEILKSASEIVERAPMLAQSELDKDQWAIWEPRGGFVNTRLASQVLMEAARQLGAVALEGVEVTHLCQHSRGIEIHTDGGTVATSHVIVATGARLPELIPDSKVFCRTIPLTAMRHSLLDEDVGSLYQQKCCVIDENSKSYLRPEKGRFIYGGGAEQVDGDSLADCQADWQSNFLQNARLARKLLNDSSLRKVSGVAGYDAYTSSFEPVIKYPDDLHRVGAFAGFSGRGAKYIPSAAKLYSNRVSSFLFHMGKEDAEHA